MINLKIFKAVLMTATKETKDAVLQALIEHVGKTYDYNDAKAGHIIEMLVDKTAIVTPEKVNLKWVEANPERLIYQHEKYNIKNISVDSVDNIDCTVRIAYKYIEKINEDRDDVSYSPSFSDISFNDNPEILK